MTSSPATSAPLVPRPEEADRVFPLPRGQRIAIGVLSVIGLVVCLVGAVFDVLNLFWLFLGFDVITAGASLFGVALALGYFREGPGLTLLCLAGAYATAGIVTDPLNYLRIPEGVPVSDLAQGSLASENLFYIGLVQLVIGAVFLIPAALTVLNRRPGLSYPMLIKGILLAVPALLAAGAWALGGTRSAMLGLSPTLTTLAAIGCGLVFIAFASAGGHCIITAFEIGRTTGAAPAESD